MENPDRNHFNIEIYVPGISRQDIGLFLSVTIAVSISLLLWITRTGHTTLFAFLQAIIFIIFAVSMVIKWRTATILTRDAFIQTQPQGVVPWEDIDRIEVQKRIVTIYYKKNESTKKLIFYLADKRKEQLIESLRNASGIFGFLFEEKPG